MKGEINNYFLCALGYNLLHKRNNLTDVRDRDKPRRAVIEQFTYTCWSCLHSYRCSGTYIPISLMLFCLAITYKQPPGSMLDFMCCISMSSLYIFLKNQNIVYKKTMAKVKEADSLQLEYHLLINITNAKSYLF